MGRALSRVASFRGVSAQPVERTIVCLEPTEKDQATTLIRQAGVRLILSPSPEESKRLAREADIVQLEWWHHPLTMEWMARCASSFPARWVVWSHTSGLHYPNIPRGFVQGAQAFLFTTPVSLGLCNPDDLRSEGTDAPIVGVVASSGGFDDIPLAIKESRVHLNYGYLGSLNFAKLHPDIIRYLEAVDIPGFSVDFHGDIFSNPRLKDIAFKAGISERVRILGYTDRPYEALAQMDVLIYLLSPFHYGTTENALIEAMACSTVPVVLDNPVESSIVNNGVTGIVVDSPETFAEAIGFLSDHPDERRKMGAAARREVTTNYSLETTVGKLSDFYSRVAGLGKRNFDFGEIFGNSPVEWFASCLGKYAPLFADSSGLEFRDQRLLHPVLYERSKSSVFHFLRYFHSDPQLKQWASMLEGDLAAA